MRRPWTPRRAMFWHGASLVGLGLALVAFSPLAALVVGCGLAVMWGCRGSGSVVH